jgi:hypothetical protein
MDRAEMKFSRHFYAVRHVENDNHSSGMSGLLAIARPLRFDAAGDLANDDP